MRIALITSSDEREFSGAAELRAAISGLGHDACEFFVDKAAVRMGSRGVSLLHIVGRAMAADASFDAALMRNIGIIRDYEQFGHRIWTVRALELSGTCVMNEISKWIPASDKLATLATLARAGLPVPETVSSEDLFAGYEAAKEFGSVVVKPLRSGLGLGVFKLDDPDAAMHIFSYFTSLNKPIYVQRFLEKKGGGDYRVVVVGGVAVGAEFRKGATWKSSIAQGAVPSKAKLTDELGELAVRAAEAMGLEFAGVDIAETPDGYFILETNPTIAWAGFRSVTGINPAELIVRHLLDRIKR
jgi:ribosomal protein S6--L-glutamate ligase